MIAAPRRLSPPGEAGGAAVPLRRRRAGGTGRRWRGARGGAARPESAATWRGMMRSRRWMGARGPLNEGMRTRSGPSSYQHHPPAAARPAGRKTRIGDFSGFNRDSASLWSMQTPKGTRSCDLRGAESRGRSTCYASYVDEPLMMVSGAGTKHYFHQNHLYSVAAMTNSSGAVVERYRYDAHGKRTILAADGTTVRTVSSYGNQIGFTGRYHDAETGLLYYRNRMANPGTGRYLSRNTISLHDNLKYTFSIKMSPVQFNVRDIGLGYFRDKAELSTAALIGKVPGLEYIDGLSSYTWPQGLDPSGEPGGPFDSFDNLFDTLQNLFDRAQAAGEIPDDINDCKQALGAYQADPNRETCYEACIACTLPFAGVAGLGATVALGQCKCACDEKHP